MSPLAEAAMLLAVLFVGTDFVVAKYSLEDLPPLLLAAMRFTVAGVLLCVFVRVLALGRAPEKKDLIPLAGLGAVGVSLNQGAYLSGLSMTNGSDAALMFASAPVWGLLFGAVFGLERARLGGVAGILIALLGVGLVVYDGLGQAGASLVGDLLVLLSALSWGAYAVLSLPMLSRYPPMTMAAYTVLPGGLLLAVFAVPQAGGVDWGAVGWGAWAGVAYSTLLTSAFSFAAWQLGVSRMGAGRTLAYLYLVTIVGVASSALLLGDPVGFAKILGAFAILLGVYLARRP